ncbi:dihydrofolate reductase [Bradyrhizobium sp. USDA 3311]
MVDEIVALKAESGRNLIDFGGAGFASALGANDVVDEHQFYMNQVALGEGLSIPSELPRASKIRAAGGEGYRL